MAKEIILTEIRGGAYCSQKRKGHHLVQNTGDLKLIGFQGQLPEELLTNHTFICVFRGEFPTGGYAVEIVKATEYDDYIQVEVVETNPSGGAVTHALSQPFHIVAIPKTKKPIRFWTSAKVTDKAWTIIVKGGRDYYCPSSIVTRVEANPATYNTTGLVGSQDDFEGPIPVFDLDLAMNGKNVCRNKSLVHIRLRSGEIVSLICDIILHQDEKDDSAHSLMEELEQIRLEDKVPWAKRYIAAAHGSRN